MGRRVLVIVMVLVVALFVYLGYNSYDAKRAGLSGDVFFERFCRMSKSRLADGSRRRAAPSTGQTVCIRLLQCKLYPVTPETTQSQNDAQIRRVRRRRMEVAAGDTISPNPPNGMVFAGKGKYQLYRQGNLTWRLNTETGQTCIIFATDEEWKKPKGVSRWVWEPLD